MELGITTDSSFQFIRMVARVMDLSFVVYIQTSILNKTRALEYEPSIEK